MMQSKQKEKTSNFSKNFRCPITHERMLEPVIAADGHSYEKAAIELWIKTRGGRAISPLTGQQLEHLVLTPNYTVRKIMDDYQTMSPEMPHKKLNEEDLLLAIKLQEEELIAQLAKQGKQLPKDVPMLQEINEKPAPLSDTIQHLTQKNEENERLIQQLQTDIEQLHKNAVDGRWGKDTLSDDILLEHLFEIQRLSQSLERLRESHAANRIKRAMATYISHKQLKQTGLIQQEEDVLHQLEILQQATQQKHAALERQLEESIEVLEEGFKLALAKIAQQISSHANEDGDDEQIEKLAAERRQLRETHAVDKQRYLIEHATAKSQETEAHKLKAEAQKVRLQHIKGSKSSKWRALSRWTGYTARFTAIIEHEREQLAEIMAERAAVSERLARYTKLSAVNAESITQKPAELIKYWSMVFNAIKAPDEEQQRFLTELKLALNQHSSGLFLLQSITQALLTAMKDEDNYVRSAAIDVLGKLGQANPEVIQTLLTVMKDGKDEWIRDEAAMALGELGQTNPEIIRALLTLVKESVGDVIRNAAAKILEKVEQASSEVIQMLLTAVKDKNSRASYTAVKVLGKIGQTNPEAIQALVIAVKDGDYNVRRHAIAALGELGQANPEVTQALLIAVNNEDSGVCSDAVKALFKLRQSSAEVTPMLAIAMKDKDIDHKIMEVLGTLGQSRLEVILTLLTTIKDKVICRIIMNALGKLRQTSPENIQVLVTVAMMMNDDEDSDVYFIERALEELGQELEKTNPEVILTRLAETKDNENENVYYEAVLALVNLGQASSGGIATLLTAVEGDKGWDVYSIVVEVLEKLVQVSPELIQALVMAVKNKNISYIDRIEIVKALGKLGEASPKVIQALLRVMKEGEYETVRCAAVKALNKLGYSDPEVIEALLAVVKDGKGSEIYSAAIALDKLGQASPEVIQALVTMVKDNINTEICCSAAAALINLGQASPELIPELIPVLLPTREYVERHEPIIRDDYTIKAALALNKLVQTNPTEEVTQALLAAIKDNNIRCAALATLGELRQANPEVIAALLVAVKDEDFKICCAAVRALGKLEQSSPEVIQTLLTVMNGYGARQHAAEEVLLKLVGSNPKVIQTVLKDEKNEKDERIYHAAVKALEKLGQTSPEIIQTLIYVVAKNKNDTVRCAAVEALGKLEQPSVGVFQALLTVLKDDKDYDVRRIAVEALGKLGQSSVEILQALLTVVKDDKDHDYYNVRRVAVEVLGKLGQSSVEVLQALLTVVKDEKDYHVRCAAVEALSKLEQSNPEVIQVLLTVVKDEKDYHVRCVAVEALGKLGQSNVKILQALLVVKNDKDYHVRCVAVEALSKLGQTSSEVIQALMVEMKGKSVTIRNAVVKTLGNLKPSAEIIQVLMTVIEEKSYDVPYTAKEALSKLEQTNPTEIVPALLAVAKDERVNVRYRVVETLGRIGKTIQKQLLEDAQHLENLLDQWQEKYFSKNKVPNIEKNWFSVLLSSASNSTFFKSMNVVKSQQFSLEEASKNQQAEPIPEQLKHIDIQPRFK